MYKNKLIISLLLLVGCLVVGSCSSIPDSGPIKPAKYSEVIRVACIGDSITFGAGVEKRLKNSYPVQLGKMLGEQWETRGSLIDQVRIGTAGYRGPMQPRRVDMGFQVVDAQEGQVACQG